MNKIIEALMKLQNDQQSQKDQAKEEKGTLYFMALDQVMDDFFESKAGLSSYHLREYLTEEEPYPHQRLQSLKLNDAWNVFNLWEAEDREALIETIDNNVDSLTSFAEKAWGKAHVALAVKYRSKNLNIDSVTLDELVGHRTAATKDFGSIELNVIYDAGSHSAACGNEYLNPFAIDSDEYQAYKEGWELGEFDRLSNIELTEDDLDLDEGMSP